MDRRGRYILFFDLWNSFKFHSGKSLMLLKTFIGEYQLWRKLKAMLRALLSLRRSPFCQFSIKFLNFFFLEWIKASSSFEFPRS
jgi:hypothetical protein